jgi:FG-GAP-like repeat/Dockerin type I domain
MIVEALEGRVLFSYGQPSLGVPSPEQLGATSGLVQGLLASQTPPSLTSVVIGSGTSQRSIFNSFTLVFSQAVTLAPGAVTLNQVTTSANGTILTSTSVPASAFTITNPSADGQTWVVQVTPGGTLDGGRGVFKDGVYQYALHAALITSAGGLPLSGGDQIGAFRKIFGDYNGDGKISNADFTQFSNAYGSRAGDPNFQSAFDYNFDNRISNSDFTQFANRFGMALFLPTAPSNDNLANAIVLTGSSVMTTGTNALATKEPFEPDHANNAGGASVWWTWTAPAYGTVTISTAGSNFDTLLAAYRGGDIASLARVASNDDNPNSGDTTSIIRFKAIAGTTYDIAVDGYDGATGNISLSLTLSTTYASIASRATQTGQWFVSKSNGSGFNTTLWETWDPSVNWVDAVKGDFNGDGKTDIAARNASTGDWYMGISSGSGFTTSIWDTWNPSVNWVDVRVGDFNGDGRDDIAGRNSATGQWSVALSKGGGFSTGTWDTWSPSVTWSDVQVGDFNDDGRSDIVGRDAATGQWWVATSTGAQFSNGIWDTWSPSVTWVDVHVGDFNGDGRSDIIGRASATGQWWVGISNGVAFSTSLWATWSPSVNWVDVNVGDFNGDGRSDIIGRNAATGQWWVGTSNGTTFTTSLWATWSPAVNWSDVQIGDFTGDGRDDIVGRDPSTGEVWVAASNGTGFNTTFWDTWSPAVTWTNTKSGYFLG